MQCNLHSVQAVFVSLFSITTAAELARSTAEQCAAQGNEPTAANHYEPHSGDPTPYGDTEFHPWAIFF